MTRRLLVVAVALLPALPATAARPPTYEVVWRRGGSSAPYELESFTHPAAGESIFVAGYSGGVSAVGRTGPIWRWAAGNTQVAGTAFGDLTGDGVDDAVVGQYTEEVTVLDGVDGEPLASRTFTTAPEGLALGDADGDGRLDLFVITQSSGAANNAVHLFLGAGLEPAWSVDLGAAQQYVLGADAGDVDGDGRDDVVFGTYSNGPRLYAFGSGGTKLWDADLGGAVQNVTIADDGGTVFATRTGTALFALDARTGALRWSLSGTSGFSRMAIADLTGDGRDDVAWALYGASGKSPAYQVMAVDGVLGAPAWTAPAVAPPKGIVAGDLDADGDPDVAATTQDVGPGLEGPNFVWAFEGDTGRPLWSHALAGDQTTYLADVTLADVGGDSQDEVIAAPYFNVLLGLSSRDGAQVWDMPVGSGVGSAAAVDLDGDGLPEVVEGGDDFRVTAREATTGAVRWTRDLGGQVLHVSAVPAGGGGEDVIAIALGRLVRLRGSDGSARWSVSLQGMGTDAELIPRAGAAPLLAVGARSKRSARGYGSDTQVGHLDLFDPETGELLWDLPSPGVPWYLDSGDLDGDGARDLAVGTTVNQALAVAVYDGASLATAPVPLWQSATDGTIRGLTISGGAVLTTRATVNAVVAQDGATGTERWRRAMGVATAPIGSGDVDGDGVPDLLVATEVFAEGVAAVSGATGQVLFDVPVGVRFVKAAAWTDVSGDGDPDLLVASDGGTYGDGGVLAFDGDSLGSAEPAPLWSYPDVNAYGLVRVALPDDEAWLAYGFTVRPDALTLLRPVPEDPSTD